MRFPFIELCIASGSMIRKTEYFPRRISNVLPDIHPVMSIIDKKGNRKRRSQATLIVLFYYFVLLW